MDVGRVRSWWPGDADVRVGLVGVGRVSLLLGVALFVVFAGCGNEKDGGGSGGTSGATSTDTTGTTGSSSTDATASTSSAAGGASTTSTSSTGAGGTDNSNSPCREGVVEGDAEFCPIDSSAAIRASRAPADCPDDREVSCTYESLAGETNCVHVSYVCCGVEWYGGTECPRAIEGSDPECPTFEPDTFADEPCTTEGLMCAYRPSGPGQQDVACCDGYWKGCVGRFDLGSPECTCD